MSELEITENAIEYLGGLIEKQPEGTNVRLYITEPGTSKAETCLAFSKPDSHQADDLVREYPNFSVYIELKSNPFLEEAQVDFSKDRLGGQLTIKAPNAKLPQISDESSIEDKINYILQMDVNPGLASHGGVVSLVAMDEGVAILEFGGGCQGCGMAETTMKDGVAAQLQQQIPEITEVVDETDHSAGENPYFA
jgi:Fe/S biogenesis protein NfuA